MGGDVKKSDYTSTVNLFYAIIPKEKTESGVKGGRARVICLTPWSDKKRNRPFLFGQMRLPCPQLIFFGRRVGLMV
ncbi:hypothetical protein MBAV_000465 [Candidatus Magnetobacterium bavaricum]|uniref:Uncharacterized protein n=1 Tax=Candidatus Magnetobacterium bavaricum TaxID=29290 RepID=A0A0F3GZL0_9BACT|nr:hypothetical protein MBAV_000465 [Candidatus Magnetobacterium bavaricum]